MYGLALNGQLNEIALNGQLNEIALNGQLNEIAEKYVSKSSVVV